MRRFGKETHIIYGYREINRPHRWYVGRKLYRRKDIRDEDHRKGSSGSRKFNEFVHHKVKQGKTFDDLFEYFELETFFGYERQADIREGVYIDLYNAVWPNGFCLSGGATGDSIETFCLRRDKNKKGATKSLTKYIYPTIKERKKTKMSKGINISGLPGRSVILVPGKFISVSDASALLSVPTSELYREVDRGVLPIRKKAPVKGIPVVEFCKYAQGKGVGVAPISDIPKLMA